MQHVTILESINPMLVGFLVGSLIWNFKQLRDNLLCRRHSSRLQATIDGHEQQLQQETARADEWAAYADATQDDLDTATAKANGRQADVIRLRDEVGTLHKDVARLSNDVAHHKQLAITANAERDEASNQVDMLQHDLDNALSTLSSKGMEPKQTQFTRNYTREIAQYRQANPDANKKQVMSALDIGSRNTLNKYWDMPTDDVLMAA